MDKEISSRLSLHIDTRNSNFNIVYHTIFYLPEIILNQGPDASPVPE